MKMVKVAIIDKTGKKISDYDFKLTGDIREDIFKKAVFSENSMFKQSYGSDPMAGKNHAINVSKRRKGFRSTYGRGGSRTPKKAMWSRGTQFRFVGAFAPNTVGGRKAHPPKAEKNIIKNMNNKEWLKALETGVLASFDRSIVESNGQRIPSNYPFILDSSLEDLNKTAEVKTFLESIGFKDEIERISTRKVRAGKGTMRNRTYRTKRGPILVVSSIEKPLLKSARNIKGFEVVTPEFLMVSDFGMSEKPGRAVLFTKDAIEEFMEVFN